MVISKELVSGVLFILVGAFAVTEAQTYKMGSLTQMGPGYLPTVVGGLLILCGLALSVQAWLRGGGRLDAISLRALLIIPLGIVVFAMLLDPAGLIAATIALILIVRSAARRPLGWLATLMLAGGLLAFGVLVFWYVLGLPLRLWP